MSPSKLIQAVTEFTMYQEHLRKTQEDHENRWDNVQELMNFAVEIENSMPEATSKMMGDAEGAAQEELLGHQVREVQAVAENRSGV